MRGGKLGQEWQCYGVRFIRQLCFAGFPCMVEEAPENANSMNIIARRQAYEVSKILSSVKLKRLQSKWRQCNLLACVTGLFIYRSTGDPPTTSFI